MGSWLDPLKRRAVLWNRRRLHHRMQARMPAYADWCARFDSLDRDTLAALQQRKQALAEGPTLCLLLTAELGDLQAHQRFLAALQAQIYAHWTLVVGPATGTAPAVLALWQTQAALDPRIRLATATARGAACRAALLQASPGAWVVFTDAHDIWREHALLLLAEAAAHWPAAALVYADEDRIDDKGQRLDPQFKPDWNATLLLSHDCVGRPALWQAAHLRGLHLFSAPADAVWRHDLALRATAGLAAQRCVHVPHVLCQRSSAAGAEATASVPAVQAHLDRMGAHAQAQAQPGFDGVRVRFELPQPAPQVTIVIPTRNGLQLLRQCIASIVERSTYAAYDIVIIDNGSDEADCLRYLQQVVQDPRISVRRDESPFNFAALNNAAIAQARGEFVALVNNDIEVITADWLQEMVSLAARPGAGAVGARLWYSDGTLQHGGVITGIGGGAGHAHKRLMRNEPGMVGRAQRLQALSAVTAACLVVRRASYLAVGGMDAAAYAVAFNDVDFCLRLRAAGLTNVWTPFAELFHHESVSRGSDHQPAKKLRFERERDALRARWGASLEHDPAYNPNLTLNNENFALANPPRVSLRRPWFNPETAHDHPTP